MLKYKQLFDWIKLLNYLLQLQATSESFGCQAKKQTAETVLFELA